MRCPDDVELAGWLDGSLPAGRAEAIRLHLAECLECRLVVGAPSDAAAPGQPDDEGKAPLPPFHEIQRRLRAAFEGRRESDAPFRIARVEEYAPIPMAADTDSHPVALSIPSFYGEEGRLVVTFRTDAEGRVTAFFVSEEIERVRFRVLNVGEGQFLSNAEGRVILQGLSAEDVLGNEISVPRIIASASCPYPEITTQWTPLDLGRDPPRARPPERDAAHRDLAGADFTPARIRVRAASEEDRRIILRLEGPAGARATVVAVVDEHEACLLIVAEGKEASCRWRTDAPRTIRFDLIDRA